MVRKAFIYMVSAFVLVFGVLSCTGCSTSSKVSEHAYVSPYDWENLIYENDRYSYYSNNIKASRTGIDVSDHQETIDWYQVAGDGIEFAMIRLGNRGATEGQIYLDEQYYANIEGAQTQGLLTGVYFFSQAINEQEAREEAEFVLMHLQGTYLDYPVVFDYEPIPELDGRANNLTSAQVTENARVFCEIIEAAGYTPMIYGNKQDLALLDRELLGAYDTWFAEYDALNPTAQFDFTVWQYTSSGLVQGINTPVDMNIHFLGLKSSRI